MNCIADKPKTITINGKIFEIPNVNVLCEKCGTTSYFYDYDRPPFRCEKCGIVFKYLHIKPLFDSDQEI